MLGERFFVEKRHHDETLTNRNRRGSHEGFWRYVALPPICFFPLLHRQLLRKTGNRIGWFSSTKQIPTRHTAPQAFFCCHPHFCSARLDTLHSVKCRVFNNANLLALLALLSALREITHRAPRDVRQGLSPCRLPSQAWRSAAHGRTKPQARPASRR